jgi:N-acetylglutamate synthase/N-acetylornithine aminotransferase
VPSAARGYADRPVLRSRYVATDDPAFVLAAVENARQGVIDAGSATSVTGNAGLRATAEKIRAHNKATSQKLEQLAAVKGWPDGCVHRPIQ